MSVAERVDGLFSFLDEPGMPGAAVAVLHRGEVLHARGYGLADVDAGVRFTPATPFPIASMTKQFTTTCILLLEEEGRLSLRDDYRRFLPGMPDFGSPITLAHLCTNTSGIRDIFPLTTLCGGWRLDPRPRPLTEGVLGRQRTLNFPTGSQYRYSNPNFYVLGWIVERVTGRTLAEFMAERIFEPLGMRDTALHDWRGPARTGGARCYDGTTRNDLRPSEWERFSRSGSGEGGGAIWSTLDDLVRWERNFDRNAVGSAGLLQRLPCPPRIPGGDESFYGLGLMTGVHRGLRWESHSGTFGPCASNRVRLPSRATSAIVLSNSSLVEPHLRAFELADVLLDEDPSLPPPPGFGAVAAEAVEPWLGTYDVPGTGLSFGLAAREGMARVVSFGAEARLEEERPGVLLAARGGSLPVRVTLGVPRPEPEITVQLGPNPPMRLRRSAAPEGPLGVFEGEYFSEELDATHTVERHEGGLAVTIDGPLGRRERLPLERASRTTFIARCDAEQRALYSFPHGAGGEPDGLIVSIARAEGLLLRRGGRGRP